MRRMDDLRSLGRWPSFFVRPLSFVVSVVGCPLSLVKRMSGKGRVADEGPWTTDAKDQSTDQAPRTKSKGPSSYQNKTLSAVVTASTMTASTAGRAYHARARSLCLGVRPRTRPTRSSRLRAVVTRLIAIVRTKQAVHAQTAPHRFCAMSDG